MKTIFIVEAWEDSWGGGSKWVQGYYRTRAGAEKGRPKSDGAVHYDIREVPLSE